MSVRFSVLFFFPSPLLSFSLLLFSFFFCLLRFRYNEDCDCNRYYPRGPLRGKANGRSELVFYVIIYIRTYVHMCILLSKRNREGRIARWSAADRWRSRRSKSVTYDKKIRRLISACVIRKPKRSKSCTRRTHVESRLLDRPQNSSSWKKGMQKQRTVLKHVRLCLVHFNTRRNLIHDLVAGHEYERREF